MDFILLEIRQRATRLKYKYKAFKTTNIGATTRTINIRVITGAANTGAITKTANIEAITKTANTGATGAP